MVLKLRVGLELALFSIYYFYYFLNKLLIKIINEIAGKH